MIVKNEEAVLRRCLDSVLPLIDYWIIVDTGSTDGTRTIIRAAMLSVPGELVERPWVDFAHNRSEALALARPHATFSLVIDADDQLVLPDGFKRPTLEADSYTVDIEDVGVRYQRAQVFANALPWRYAGVLHEYPTCEEARTSGHLPMVMRRNHDGARRRDPQTYRNDAAVLERALAIEADPFLVSRYTFYLAQSYRDCDEPDRALSLYLRRADLGFWDEEVYVALLNAARLRERRGLGSDETLALYARASRIRPGRAEAAHGASRLCRLAGRHGDGYGIARLAIEVTEPAGLFVESWIYTYGLLDEFAVNASWCGRHCDSRDACRRILACQDLPAADRARVAGNLQFSEERIAERWAQPAAPWRPERPQGGTELMTEGLRARLGRELDRVHLCVNQLCADPDGGRPIVLWVHHDIDQAAVQWLDDASRRAPIHRFVFVSDWQMERFLTRFGLPRERCQVIRNATEVPVVERVFVERPDAARRRLKIAYASTPYRGLAILLDAWTRLAPTDAELHVWSSHTLYGPAFDDAAHAALFARARTLPGVHLHGIVPHADLCEALRDCDILAYPNTFPETSCLVAIEALAAGCRIICPAQGALPETVDRYAHLYSFLEDPDAHAAGFAEHLAAEIDNLWQGEPRIMLDQQRFACERYDWTGRVAEWQALIGDVTSPPEAAIVAPPLAPQSDDRVFQALCRLKAGGFDPVGIIDAGAYNGDFARLARGIFPDAHILMIDALPEQEPALRRAAEEIGNAATTISLIGARDRAAASFFVVDTAARPDLVKTGSSTFRENSVFPATERRVAQRSLATILSGRDRRFQMLKLDLQGAELEALRGLGKVRLRGLEIILIEMSLVAYNQGGPLMHEVMTELARLGFVLYDLVEDHRYRDGGLLQVDGLFLRATSPLRPTPPFWS